MYMYKRGTLLTYNDICVHVLERDLQFFQIHTLGFILYSCNIMITQLIIQQPARKSAVISFLSGHEFGIQTTGLYKNVAHYNVL